MLCWTASELAACRSIHGRRRLGLFLPSPSVSLESSWHFLLCLLNNPWRRATDEWFEFLK